LVRTNIAHKETMKQLWVTAKLFPALAKELGIPDYGRGGWTYSLADQLLARSDMQLAVASFHFDREFKEFDIEGVRYYLLPIASLTKYESALEPYWKKICSEFEPDLVHIHGTEYTPGLALMKSCPDEKYLVSIQGLTSVIERYYFAGMNHWSILKSSTLRDLIRNELLFRQKKSYLKRGVYEKEYLRRAQHVTGRTTWDKVHVQNINPDAEYYSCHRILRSEFSEVSWDLLKVERCSIFLSQAAYPIKGLHMALKALSIIVQSYPQTRMYIAGPDITRSGSFKARMSISGYGKYIKKLIKKYSLMNHVVFYGDLGAPEMTDAFRKAHVFVSPSSIDNSPNSVAEAQTLGTPCVASYVGGVPDMVQHEETGILYPFEEYEMLAYHVCRIFADDGLARHLSENGRKMAAKRHMPDDIGQTMVEIYEKINTH